MATNRVIIDILTKGAQKATSNLGSVAKSIGGLAGAYLGARGLVNGIQASLDAFGKQEMAEKKLETALGKTSQALLDQASALQKVTTFGDEDIIMMQSMFASFGQNEEQIKKLTSATLDLSAGMGIDLKSAGDLVAKTIGSSTNAMSRYGVEVTGAVGSSERLETLTGNITKLFGGQAKAQADTYAGSIEQMNNAIGDMAESIGELLAPAILKIAPKIQMIAEFWGDVFTKNLTDSVDPLSDTEERLNSLNELLKIQRDRLGNVIQQYGFNSEEANKVVEGIDRTKDSIAQLNQEVYFPNAGADPPPLPPTMDPEQLEESRQAAKKLADATKEAEEQKARAREASAIAIGASSMNTAEAIRSVIKAYLAEAVAGMISKEIAGKGLAGLITGAIGASAVNIMFENLVPKFAEKGMNEVVTEPTMIIAGENGAEQVNITPLDGTGEAGSGINLYFNSPVTNAEFVRDVIIPEINNAKRLGLA